MADCALADGAQRRELHAKGRKHTREGMNVNARHAEGIGDETGMLSRSAAEAVERIAAGVVAAGNRYPFDGVCHIFNGDADEAVGNLFGRTIVLAGDGLKSRPYAFCVDGLIAARAENTR